MRFEILCLFLGMTLVTYIPRLIPVFLVGRIQLNPKIEKFLQLIPFTAMAALIFPGVIFTDPSNLWIGILGGATAIILAWLRMNVMVCVLAAIAVDFCIYTFM